MVLSLLSLTIGRSCRCQCDYTGPPGTGKTTTIAGAAAIWESHGLPCWIVAQSNVGVKNIAEKLFQKGVDFKLVVSLEFFFEW
jgi:AAA domain